jgi:hypothetical protein
MREQSKPVENRRLADISTVRVDPNLPKYVRIAEYVREMNGEPNHFFACDIEVTSFHPKDGPLIEDCLKRIPL